MGHLTVNVAYHDRLSLNSTKFLTTRVGDFQSAPYHEFISETSTKRHHLRNGIVSCTVASRHGELWLSWPTFRLSDLSWRAAVGLRRDTRDADRHL